MGFLLWYLPQVEGFLCCFSLQTGCKIIAAWELIRHIVYMSSGLALAPTGNCGLPEYIILVYILDLIAISTVFGGTSIFIFALVFLVFTSGKNKVTAGNCASVFSHCLMVSVIAELSSLLTLMIHAFLSQCSVTPWAVTFETAANCLGIYNVIVIHSYSVRLKKPATNESLPDDDVTKIIRLRSISVNPPEEQNKKEVSSHLYSSYRRLQSITDISLDEHESNWGSQSLSEKSNKEFEAKNKNDLDNKDKDKKCLDKNDRGNKENEDKYNQPGSSKTSKY